MLWQRPIKLICWEYLVYLNCIALVRKHNTVLRRIKQTIKNLMKFQRLIKFDTFKLYSILLKILTPLVKIPTNICSCSIQLEAKMSFHFCYVSLYFFIDFMLIYVIVSVSMVFIQPHFFYVFRENSIPAVRLLFRENSLPRL